jgi:hypothetical protein
VPEPPEPNDQTPIPLVGGNTYGLLGSIAHPGDRDPFQIDVAAGTLVVVSLGEAHSRDLLVTLDTDQGTFAVSPRFRNNTLSVSFEATQTQTVTLKVSAFGEATNLVYGALVTVVPPAAFSIERIPHIMRRIGWSEAATLQRLWFGGPAHVSEKTPDFTADVVQMDLMGLVLGTSRGRNALATLQRGRAPQAPRFFAGLGRRRLEGRLVRMFEQIPAGDLGGGVVKAGAFGDFTRDAASLHAQRMYGEPIRAYVLDRVGGALGRFSLSVVPKGSATMSRDGTISYTLTEIGVYILDSFEFGGFQPLGSWKSPNGVRARPVSSGGFTAVSNSSYRTYRAATGRGRDMLVLSEVMPIRLAKPIVAKFRPRAV